MPRQILSCLWEIPLLDSAKGEHAARLTQLAMALRNTTVDKNSKIYANMPAGPRFGGDATAEVDAFAGTSLDPKTATYELLTERLERSLCHRCGTAADPTTLFYGISLLEKTSQDYGDGVVEGWSSDLRPIIA